MRAVARQAFTAKSDLDLVDVHTMPKKTTKSAAATEMGPITRSRSVPDTVGEVPLTAEQEERSIQAALAQTANDAATRSRSMQDTMGGVTLTPKRRSTIYRWLWLKLLRMQTLAKWQGTL